MTVFRHILSPVDFSDCSRHALDHALAIAQWYGGTVTALHVMPQLAYADPIIGGALLYTPEDLDRAHAELDRLVAAEAGTTPVETRIMSGSAGAAIVEEAKDLPADLVVLGTHGRSGFTRLMLGSVTERVLRHAPCPVLTVPPRVPDVVPTGPVMFHRILCAVDFSASSLKALAYAASLARETGAHLTLTHVVELAPVYEPALIGGNSLTADIEVAAERATRGRLETLAPAGVPVSTVVTSGKPYRQVLALAESEKSDLIVIGVHGGLGDRLHFGSTTNHVVRAAACPVLSLRA